MYSNLVWTIVANHCNSVMVISCSQPSLNSLTDVQLHLDLNCGWVIPETYFVKVIPLSIWRCALGHCCAERLNSFASLFYEQKPKCISQIWLVFGAINFSLQFEFGLIRPLGYRLAYVFWGQFLQCFLLWIIIIFF